MRSTKQKSGWQSATEKDLSVNLSPKKSEESRSPVMKQKLFPGKPMQNEPPESGLQKLMPPRSKEIGRASCREGVEVGAGARPWQEGGRGGWCVRRRRNDSQRQAGMH